MREKERKRSRLLRSRGLSLRAIAAEIRCSKSLVSKWISDIKLTDEQIKKLKSNQDRGRALAAKHPNSSRQKWEKIRSGIKDASVKDIPSSCSRDLLRIVGAALYWAEGYNASRAEIIFANTDPDMIRLMALFFRRVCNVKSTKLRGKVAIHPHLDIRAAEKYWSKVSGIPLSQFNKPLLALSRARKGKRDTLPMGTFSILFCDVYTCSKIKGWIEGLGNWVKKPGG